MVLSSQWEIRFVSRTYRCSDSRISFAHWALNDRRPLDGDRFGPLAGSGAEPRKKNKIKKLLQFLGLQHGAHEAFARAVVGIAQVGA